METWSLKELQEVWFFSLPLSLGFLRESVWSEPERTPQSPTCHLEHPACEGEGPAVGKVSRAVTSGERPGAKNRHSSQDTSEHSKSDSLTASSFKSPAGSFTAWADTVEEDRGSARVKLYTSGHLMKIRQIGQTAIWNCRLLSRSRQSWVPGSGWSSPLILPRAASSDGGLSSNQGFWVQAG